MIKVVFFSNRADFDSIIVHFGLLKFSESFLLLNNCHQIIGAYLFSYISIDRNLNFSQENHLINVSIFDTKLYFCHDMGSSCFQILKLILGNNWNYFCFRYKSFMAILENDRGQKAFNNTKLAKFQRKFV